MRGVRANTPTARTQSCLGRRDPAAVTDQSALSSAARIGNRSTSSRPKLIERVPGSRTQWPEEWKNLFGPNATVRPHILDIFQETNRCQLPHVIVALGVQAFQERTHGGELALIARLMKREQ